MLRLRTPAVVSFGAAALALAMGCYSGEEAPGLGEQEGVDGGVDDASLDAEDGDGADGDDADGPPPFDFCALPGSYVHDASGVHVVAGGLDSPDLSWVQVPEGFCVHHFATVPVARAMRFAPGGELFVTSPTASTTGGGRNGLAAIAVVADDDHDGYGDAPTIFADSLPWTQGLLFVPGWFYWQGGDPADDHSPGGTKVLRAPYAPGQRALSGAPEEVADITIYRSSIHWPKSLDAADDGTIYVSNGGDQGEACDPARPFHGGVLELDGSPGAKPIVKGLRNPIAVRCQRGHGRCYATELARDYSAALAGREKLLPIHAGDDWGYPCCASKDLPYTDVMPVPDCSGVAPETSSFVIGNTPFGFDFEPGGFPEPWRRSVFVTLHGEFGTWFGAEIVAIATDPATGEPLPSSNLDGGASGAMQSFVQGWDDGTKTHGRPADVTFAADGRMFVADDVNGEIFWVSPVGSGIAPDGGLVDAGDGGAADGATDGAHPEAGDASFDGNLGCASAFVSFAADVQPIFAAECTRCHDGTANPSGGLSLVAGVSRGNVVNQPATWCAGRKLVVPGEPSKSYLYSLIQGVDTCDAMEGMPPDKRILAEQIEAVRNWICMGAPDN